MGQFENGVVEIHYQPSHDETANQKLIIPDVGEASYRSSYDTPNAVTLTWLHVSPDHRGKKLGSLLFEVVVDTAVEAGYDTLVAFAANERTVSCFRRFNPEALHFSRLDIAQGRHVPLSDISLDGVAVFLQTQRLFQPGISPTDELQLQADKRIRIQAKLR